MKIQRYATGLLSLLGLKTMGNNPGEFAEIIAPSFDLRDWFLFEKRELLDGFLSWGAATSGSTVFAAMTTGDLVSPIPADELWFVWNVTLRHRILDDAGYMVGSFGVSVERAGGTNYQFIKCSENAPGGLPLQGFTPGDPVNFSVYCEPMRFFDGGCAFGEHIGQFSFPGGADVEMYAEISRLKV